MQETKEVKLPKTYRSDEEAKSAATLLEEGWHPARITEALEKLTQNKKPMIALWVLVGGRTLPDWLMPNDRGAAKLRACCAACNALDAYNAQEISQDLFPGHDVEVEITIEKRKGFPPQNRIESYRSIAASSVVNLRSAG
jgi:hypothetical protein